MWLLWMVGLFRAQRLRRRVCALMFLHTTLANLMLGDFQKWSSCKAYKSNKLVANLRNLFSMRFSLSDHTLFLLLDRSTKRYCSNGRLSLNEANSALLLKDRVILSTSMEQISLIWDTSSIACSFFSWQLGHSKLRVRVPKVSVDEIESLSECWIRRCSFNVASDLKVGRAEAGQFSTGHDKKSDLRAETASWWRSLWFLEMWLRSEEALEYVFSQ